MLTSGGRRSRKTDPALPSVGNESGNKRGDEVWRELMDRDGRRAGDTPDLAPVRRDERQPAAVWRAFAWVVAGPLCFLIPIAWVAAAVLAVMYLPSISSSSGSLGDLTPSDAPAIRAEERAAELFSLPLLSRVVIVQHDPGGLPEPALRQTLDSAVALAGGGRRRRPACSARSPWPMSAASSRAPVKRGPRRSRTCSSTPRWRGRTRSPAQRTMPAPR